MANDGAGKGEGEGAGAQTSPHRAPGHLPVPVLRLRDGAWSPVEDAVAQEEPLEIRLLWDDAGLQYSRSIAVTMRTPGSDFELAAGFLYGEGIISARDAVADVAYCLDDTDDQQFNIVSVTLSNGHRFDPSRLERNFYVTSSCGVCGKAALEAIEVQGCAPIESGFSVGAAIIQRLPEALRAAQGVFERTGGLHAAGVFDVSGALMALYEDVGRHNALDKLVGHHFLAGTLPLKDSVLLLSGRASFELLQKAAMARIPVVAAVGAPSSLAVDLAREFNITLAGFVRAGGFNIYTAAERIQR